MNIGNYIHQLLLENDMVIIPGFGAFVSTYKSAEIDVDTNEIKPPSKEISFNQQIRNNDGLLVGCIAEGEVISHFDALKKIEKERENIFYQLDKDGKIILEETGKLFYNENNEIQFEPFRDENLLLDSFGLETVSLETPIGEETDDVIIKPEKSNLQNDEIITEPEQGKPEPVITPKVEKEISEDQPKQTATQILYGETEKEENKKRNWLWLLLILAPIIVVGIFITLQKTNKKIPPNDISEKPNLSIKKEPVLKTDTVLIDSVPELIHDTSQTKEIETIIPDSPKFYLVGGSFKEEENANTYLSQLKDEGFEPFLLGKRGNFYIVGIGIYSSEKEALVAKRDYEEKNPNSGAWIHEE